MILISHCGISINGCPILWVQFTLVKRIYTLYCENKDIIDAVTEKKLLPPVDEKTILSFVKFRNKTVHDGIINWGNIAQIYSPLLALLYSCFFK